METACNYRGFVFQNIAWLVQSCTPERKVILIETSRGIAPPQTNSGDLIYSVAGAETPLVLRKIGNHFRLIGECLFIDPRSFASYVDGDGERKLKTWLYKYPEELLTALTII
jgi:hypothetical protein